MRTNRFITALVTILITVAFSAGLALARDRWSPEQANAWYQRLPWLAGSNFGPASAINQLEMWQAESFDPAGIDRELGWAQDLGFTSMRVFLHHLPYEQDPQGFLSRMDQFLGIAAKHRIGIMFVLFDSCWDPNPRLGKQRDPQPGLHNSGWVQCPGNADLANPQRYPVLEQYVKGVIGRFKNDPRVHAWDIWNEPDNQNDSSYGKNKLKLELPNKLELTLPLLEKAFAWAQQSDPSQPITSGVWIGTWGDPEELSPTERIQIGQSDVISYHCYGKPEVMREAVQNLRRYNRPLLCTEYMARPQGSTFDPILGYLQEQKVGAYNWGFVSGKTNTIYPWDSWQKPYAAEPPVWFHDIFRTDGTPYIAKEVEYIKGITKRAAAASPQADAEAVGRFPELSAFPGKGPLRSADWFKNVWRERRVYAWNHRQDEKGAVVFLGDSITQGWSTLARDFPNLRVANRGISGDVTRGVMYRLQQDVLDLDPAAVVLLIGTNDLEEGASPELIAENTGQILSMMKAHNPKMPIIVCKVMPSHESKKRPADKIRQINALVDQIVAADPQYIRCDTWSIFANAQGNAKLDEFPDLLHPNASGYVKFADAVGGILARLPWPQTGENRALRPDAISLWPNNAPGEKGDIGPERDTTKADPKIRPEQYIIRTGNVSVPQITVFRPPADRANGAAVVVCPGGGYSILAYNLEGTEICQWLNSIGVTGVLLKYRVPARKDQERYAAPLQDVQRAIGIVRQRAGEFNIDPRRIGVLGFSAGGHLAAVASNNFNARTYPAVDAADQQSCRPDFTVLIYPAYLTLKDDLTKLAPELPVTPLTPPAFIAMTQDDPIKVENAFAYSAALKAAKVPCEVHIYPSGGHGYGLRPSAHAVTTWPARVADWMQSQGFLRKPE